MLLLWHEALGSDDEQATQDELCARVLYCQDADGAALTGERLLQSLHLVQGLLAFVRVLRNRPEEASSAWTPQWASVALSRRKFFVLEVEPRVFLTLGVQPAMEIKDYRPAFEALLRDVYGMFRLFHGSIDSNLRLLPSMSSRSFEAGDRSDHGEAPSLNAQSTPVLEKQYADGMELLMEIGTTRKRLRKLRLAIDFHCHNHHDQPNDAMDDVLERLNEEELAVKAELEILLSESPAAELQRKCAIFFPTLLQAMDISGASGFSELQGLGYFPMDQPTFLALQSFVNGFHSELRVSDSSSGADKVESSALFFKGNMLWSSMKTPTIHLLYKFLRLREERGMTMIRDKIHPQIDALLLDTPPANDVGLWMKNAYEDTFLPVWASKLSYAECEAVSQMQHGPPHLRQVARSLHKQHPVSLSTFLSDTPPLSGGGNILSPSSSVVSSPFGSPSHSPASSRLGPPKSSGLNGGHAHSKNAIKARSSSISFRNAGLLLKNGRFSKLLQACSGVPASRTSRETESVWSPLIYPLKDTDVCSSDPPEAAIAIATSQSARHRVVVWHEADLTMIVMLRLKNNTRSPEDLNVATLERLEDYLDDQQRFLNLAQLISTRYYTTFAPEKNVPNLLPLPPFVYLNRVNLAFRMQHVPRLLKSKEEDLFPVPVKLLAQYFPSSTMALLNDLHEELQGSRSAGNREICVRTRHSGWVLAKKSETSHRELYVFFDSKISSVHDLSDSLQTLLHDQFGNVLF